MGASQFVGRVGGLAVALGIGAGVFAGAGAAWADGSAPDTRSSTGSATDSASDSPQSTSSNRGRAATAVRGPAAAEPEAVAVEPEAVAVELEPEPTPEPKIHIDPDFEEPPTGSVDPVDESAVEPTVDPTVDPTVENLETTTETTEGTVEEPAGPALEERQQVVVADPGDVGEVAVVALESGTAVPLQTALTATTTSAPTANANTAPLTVAPVSTYFDGVLQGNLNVTSANGCGLIGNDCKLVYSLVDTSDGGKARFGNVPTALDPLLPVGAKGGSGSYTFLPYATWIDPDQPTSFPTATGTQTFTFRVSENTEFNQTVTSIPLIGLFAAPIIDLMQQLPLISSLLAPLIGASLTSTVTLNVGQLAAGKQVAYTYTVDSFDGTPISMNYFPASENSLLPALGNKQATIFNGPGLGAAGETNPYGLFQAAGSAPGLALIRGQGLPAPFNQAPLGFNVITWDPRGEWDSGGVLQLDNPFYEGRDVSSLIDWAEVNTPLLFEGGKPDIAMMGGSYGGGIQMTTVDPRIKAIVPAIAWNSLNQSLYPDNVFKTAWANALAEALLLSGASSIDRINAQVTQALLTGNLFGFISQSGQAVLASSGPTSLLTKLNVPTMYVQGIVDALFPLEQSIENAQTQLEQNPFFADKEELVKLIWFCGGHGVCTTFTAEQQTEQATLVFLQNMVWVNNYTKDYLQVGPFAPVGGLLQQFLDVTAPIQWWDQNAAPWVSTDMPWTSDFKDVPITGGNLEGGQINSFTSRSGPLTAEDAAGAVCTSIAQACGYPLNQVFATKAKNAVEVVIPIPASTDEKDPDIFIVGAPTVSFSYSGIGNAKAIYAQIVDDATGQVLGNINTAIPVTLDGKDHQVVDFPIANIVYSNPLPGNDATSLRLQLVANSSLYQNTAVIWSVGISDLSVSLPTAKDVFKNPLAELPI